MTADDAFKEVIEAMESDLVLNYGQLYIIVESLDSYYNNLLIEVVDNSQNNRANIKHYTRL